ncbi:MAG: hypothetical protein H6577_14525 [Lewinellaceae bacterium]|nr:hypothetical protein [Saprospiraceae bacterium]MCB9339344.1 hypothetical protein [Lewinellaceae bacterium]
MESSLARNKALGPPQRGDSTNQQHERYLAAVLFLMAAIYFLLHTKYYRYYIDDAWWVSDIWYFIKEGRMEEVLFRAPDAPDRVIIFGKLYFYIYGAFMELFGWTKGAALLLSSLITWLGAGVWWLITRQLRLSGNLQILVPLGILIFPAFFSAAHLTRPDALVFLLVSLTFFAFLKKQYFLSGLLLLMAMETHLMGVTGAFYCLAWVLYHWREYLRDWKKFLGIIARCALGAVAGMGYYYLLHQHEFSFALLYDTLTMYSGMNNFRFGFIVKYFFQYYWYRHAWELLLLLASLFIFVKNKMWKGGHFASLLLPVMVLSSFVTGRPNANYMIFVYPAFLLFMFDVFERRGWLKPMLVYVGVSLSILYGLTFFANRHFDFKKITQATAQNLPDDGLPLIAMPDNWFAAPGRPFYPIYPSVRYIPDLHLQEFYLIRNDYISHHSRNYDSLIQWLEERFDFTLVKKFNAFEDQDVEIFHCKLKNQPSL